MSWLCTPCSPARLVCASKGPQVPGSRRWLGLNCLPFRLAPLCAGPETALVAGPFCGTSLSQNNISEIGRVTAVIVGVTEAAFAPSRRHHHCK